MSAIRPTADEGSMKLSQSDFADTDNVSITLGGRLLGGIEHTTPSHEKVPEAGLSPADRNSRRSGQINATSSGAPSDDHTGAVDRRLIDRWLS
jgi:hypothetical protein